MVYSTHQWPRVCWNKQCSPELIICFKEDYDLKWNSAKSSGFTRFNRIFTVTLTFSTVYTAIYLLSSVSDDEVAVVGLKNSRFMLSVYRLRDGLALRSIKICDKPDGMAHVNLQGRPCIALCYRYNNKILSLEFSCGNRCSPLNFIDWTATS